MDLMDCDHVFPSYSSCEAANQVYYHDTMGQIKGMVLFSKDCYHASIFLFDWKVAAANENRCAPIFPLRLPTLWTDPSLSNKVRSYRLVVIQLPINLLDYVFHFYYYWFLGFTWKQWHVSRKIPCVIYTSCMYHVFFVYMNLVGSHSQPDLGLISISPYFSFSLGVENGGKAI
jgi:hypothetical protein